MSKKPQRVFITGSPAPDADELLTVSGLARALASIAPDEARTVQQIRHWSREGMLQFVRHLHLGPGVHRGYERPQGIYEAAVLCVLANMGLPISGSHILENALGQVRLEIMDRLIGKGKKKPHLRILRTAKGMTEAMVVGEGEKAPNPLLFKAAEVVVTIDVDLEKLFEQVEPHGRS